MATRAPQHRIPTLKVFRIENRQTSTQRGYGSAWQRVRLSYLQRNPLCVACSQQGRVTAASVVDHITPHKGDKQLFWDSDNWQALCKPCHSRKTAAQDGGFGNPTNGRTIGQ